EWIESRLREFATDGDEHVFAAQLNQDLQQADLFCSAAMDPKKDRCDRSPDAGWNATGYIEAVRLERHERLLIVITSVGLDCGEDDSAYAYEWQRNRWQRIWSYEQPIALGSDYRPTHVNGVRVSSPDQRTHERLLLLLGQGTGCTSNWLPIYFRLWRLHPDGDVNLLVDGAEMAFFSRDPPIEGSVSDHDATVEFRAGSLDPDFHSYEAVRRYEVEGDEVMWRQPVALGPRGFVEEWLRRGWSEASDWTAQASRAALQSSHAKLHSAYDKMGRYIGDHTQHCRKSADLWQVGIAFNGVEAFFLMRWQPPYRLQMVAVSAAPRADCDQPDASADADRTLFQDWH
ncbi:MAG TPA: hypothetical protein VMQ11_19865, partial [Alphaproteobacteria bacterium]|nr:hypothetical protein [Alphaproteobacteria bacterium]